MAGSGIRRGERLVLQPVVLLLMQMMLLLLIVEMWTGAIRSAAVVRCRRSAQDLLHIVIDHARQERHQVALISASRSIYPNGSEFI